MQTPTLVETPSGTISGLRRPTGGVPGSLPYDAVTTFLGIRYAQAPVGELRFRPPVPASRWDGVYDATSFGARAVQPTSLLAPAVEPESEDCLVLNVWTPDIEGDLPVMVWIHGGSFTTGSGSLSYYDGARLAARGVVVVSVNYRLGAFGFLHLAELDDSFVGSSNLGLMDQRLALEWIQTHIGSFGGDPAKVTIFGESAGAMSVSMHVATGADDLFRRAIAQSGAAGHVQSSARATVVAEAVLDACGLTASAAAQIRSVPTEVVRDAIAAVSAQYANDIVLPFCPTVDGVVLTDSPVELLRDGAADNVALLSGTNHAEMNLFRLQALLAGSSGDMSDERLLVRMTNMIEFWRAGLDPHETIAAYRSRHPEANNGELWSIVSTDTMFRLPMMQMLDAHAASGAPAWSYHFAHPSQAFGGALGAAHAVEIPFVFDNLHTDGVEFLLGPIDQQRLDFAAGVADAWVRFAGADDLAAHLNVPGTSEAWQPYEPTRAQAVLDVPPRLVESHETDLLERWIADADPATGR